MSIRVVQDSEVRIRAATDADWPSLWPMLRDNARAGETYTWDPDIDEAAARALWMKQPPGRTVVAVDSDGTVLGSAYLRPNQDGPGAHVANASFLVDVRHSGRGVARALCAYALDQARADGYRAMQFNAVVETNVRAVALWQAFGFEILATVPDAFRHPVHGYVGLHVMYRRL
ncbi:MAG TPA: GNAT family N-acetyltransferase [Micromonosporaceae bacterium]|nr:GNAT family N-acetyltransferase [Micromonosporaceae bacterium]